MGFKRIDPRIRRVRKKRVIKRKIIGTSVRPRLVVFRSLKNIYAQLVDDSIKKTLTTVSTVSKELKAEIKKAENKTREAEIVGKALAQKASTMNIKRIVFDRSGYLYHGRVKALADGARQGGLEF
jgi:large subunit ribosomal protein L18